MARFRHRRVLGALSAGLAWLVVALSAPAHRTHAGPLLQQAEGSIIFWPV